MKTRHTKGPWKWELGTSDICGADWNGGPIVVARVCADGLRYHENVDKADLEAGANAEFIVRACNAHEELIDILNNAKNELSTLLDEYMNNTRVGGCPSMATIQQCRAVIAKAEGG